LLLMHQSIVLAPALTDNESRQQIAIHTNEEALQKLRMLAKELIRIHPTNSILNCKDVYLGRYSSQFEGRS
jgi:hypothetical protein